MDFELSNSPFWGFITKILLLQGGFPLTWFFLGPKNRVKGGVPVTKYYSTNCNRGDTILRHSGLHTNFIQQTITSAAYESSFSNMEQFQVGYKVFE